MTESEQRHLYRSRDDRMIAGVCGGVARYFGVDPVLVRLIAVALLVLGNVATLIAYLVMTIVVPEEPLAAADTSAAGSSSSSGHLEGLSATPPIPPAPVPSGSDAAAMQPPAPSPEGRRSAGVTAGIVLIALGVLALFATLAPGVSWWQMWPLLIVAVGIGEALTPGNEGWSVARFFEGLTTVAFGLVLLANATGYLSWSVWWRYLLPLWPMWLVAIGLSLLGRGLKQNWLRALGSVVVIGWLVLGAFVMPAQAGDAWRLVWGTAGRSYSYSEPVGVVTDARLELDVGAGDVRIGSGEELVTVDSVTSFGEPRTTVTRSGETTGRQPRAEAEVSIDAGGGDGPAFWPWDVPRTDIRLAEDVAWTLAIDAGAAAIDLDASALEVGELDLGTGVSSATVRLGRPAAAGPAGRRSRAPASAVLETGVGDMRLELPTDQPARVEIRGGVTGVTVDRSLDEVEDGVYETPDYRGTPGQWRVRIEVPVGAVTVDTY